jgi:uncharacterized BrkB/YihY/UPF0761 family membrane protein
VSERPRLLHADLHLYALASAAGVVLFLYPFLHVLLTFCAYQLRSTGAVETISLAINSVFVDDLYDITRRKLVAQRTIGGGSLAVLFLSALVIVRPVSMALNRAWGRAPRRALGIDILKALLVFPCALLFLASAVLTPADPEAAAIWVGSRTGSQTAIVLLLLEVVALALSTAAAYLIYWLLPDRRRAVARILPVALASGLFLEGLKYAALLLWKPLMQERMYRQYGTFYNAMTVLVFGYVAALIILSVARFSAQISKP